jgi:predicted nucleic acid-binding Zn ribbon protein
VPRHSEEEWEWGGEDWTDEDGDEDEDATIPCPYCRRAIHEDSVRCPYCEQYISEEDAPPGRKPWWIILGVLLCLIVVGLWIMCGN